MGNGGGDEFSTRSQARTFSSSWHHCSSSRRCLSPRLDDDGDCRRLPPRSSRSLKLAAGDVGSRSWRGDDEGAVKQGRRPASRRERKTKKMIEAHHDLGIHTCFIAVGVLPLAGPRRPGERGHSKQGENEIFQHVVYGRDRPARSRGDSAQKKDKEIGRSSAPEFRDRRPTTSTVVIQNGEKNRAPIARRQVDDEFNAPANQVQRRPGARTELMAKEVILPTPTRTPRSDRLHRKSRSSRPGLKGPEKKTDITFGGSPRGQMATDRRRV